MLKYKNKNTKAKINILDRKGSLTKNKKVFTQLNRMVTKEDR